MSTTLETLSDPTTGKHSESFNTPFYPAYQQKPIQYGLKRLADIAFSSTALLIFSPLMVFAAIGIKLSSPGPVLFCQERVTQHDQPFMMYKFRSLVQNAEAQTGPTWIQDNDDRVTPFGKFLRRSHLDELPQLWNILKGEMSFIGPRPERPVFVDQFKAEGIPGYEYRHAMRTGITGYAQMRCPNPSIDQISEKTADDLYYITHWSLALDGKLLLQTTKHFLRSLFLKHH